MFLFLEACDSAIVWYTSRLGTGAWVAQMYMAGSGTGNGERLLMSRECAWVGLEVVRRDP